MASATRLPLKTVGFTVVLAAGVGASRVNIAKIITRTFTGPGSYSRIAAALLVLLNLKNMPWAWHYRVFNAILRHCIFSLPRIPQEVAPKALFMPVITTSHSPIWECDYNFHKSNSTYFSDLDVTRCHLLCCILQPGMEKLKNNKKNKIVRDQEGNVVEKPWSIMLGSVMCSFKREIGFYEGFEMWSRVLCWDKKWLYVVSHFVKKGTVKPTNYILTDGSWFGGNGYRNAKGEGKKEIDEKFIFASAIAKYVAKLGRLTIHPEVVLEAAELLPPRPGGWHTMSGPSGESTPETLQVEMNGSAEVQDAGDAEWKRVVAENQRGMEYAKHFQALEGLHQEFSGSTGPALGKYRDFLI